MSKRTNIAKPATKAAVPTIDQTSVSAIPAVLKEDSAATKVKISASKSAAIKRKAAKISQIPAEKDEPASSSAVLKEDSAATKEKVSASSSAAIKRKAVKISQIPAEKDEPASSSAVLKEDSAEKIPASSSAVLTSAKAPKRPRLEMFKGGSFTSSSSESESDDSSDEMKSRNVVEKDEPAEYMRAIALSEKFAISMQTLRRWGNSGLIKVKRMEKSSTRIYCVADVQQQIKKRTVAPKRSKIGAYTSISPLPQSGDEYVRARESQGGFDVITALRSARIGGAPNVFVDVVSPNAAWADRTQFWRLFTEVRAKKITKVYVTDAKALGGTTVFAFQAQLFKTFGATLIDLSRTA